MIVTGNIKKIMYMGKEISEARNTDKTVWVKQTVKPPPPPKPCSTTHQSDLVAVKRGVKNQLNLAVKRGVKGLFNVALVKLI